MKHLGSKKIHTERLTLRPFTMKDADMMFSHWANDDIICQNKLKMSDKIF